MKFRSGKGLGLALVLPCTVGQADGQLVTYIELKDRYVELTGMLIPCGGFDAFMAVEAIDLASSQAPPDNTDLAVYCRERVGEWILLHRLSGKLSLPESAIGLEMIDREPIAPEISYRPASAGIRAD